MIGALRGIQLEALVAASLVAAAVALSAMAQNSKPQATEGISLRARNTLSLGEQICELNGDAMQLRTVVLESEAARSRSVGPGSRISGRNRTSPPASADSSIWPRLLKNLGCKHDAQYRNPLRHMH